MRTRKAVHPLLLDPAYWRDRVRVLDQGHPGVVWTPRPDLSGAGKDVMEFRIRGHDGALLWGLFARPTWQAEPWPAAVRAVGPAVRPTIDAGTVQAGVAEFVFQEPAGRVLSDRVIDVMRVCKLALGTSGIGEVQVRIAAGATEATGDELMIVDQLLSHRIVSSLERDDAAGVNGPLNDPGPDPRDQ